jgi:hypothetical protein
MTDEGWIFAHLLAVVGGGLAAFRSRKSKEGYYVFWLSFILIFFVDFFIGWYFPGFRISKMIF